MSAPHQKNYQAKAVIVLAVILIVIVWLIVWPWGLLIDRWIWGLGIGLSVPLVVVILSGIAAIMLRRNTD